MTNNITVKMTHDGGRTNANGEYNVKIRIIQNRKKKTSRSGVFVMSEHWDEKHGHIIPKYRHEYEHEVTQIDAIYSRVKDIRIPLSNGTMSHTTAFDKLLCIQA